MIVVTSCGMSVCTSVTMISGSDSRIFWTAGKKLLTKKVTTVSVRALKAGPRSRPSIMFASRFCAAAFIALSDPVKVVAASSAVVPVMPRSVWMTWIASMILSNGTSLTFCAVTSIASPSTPESLIRRAISSCVPP